MAVVQNRLDVLAVSTDARVLAATQGARPREASALAVVVAELAHNAIEHGGGGGLVTLAVGTEGWRVEVEDTGPGLPMAVLADGGPRDSSGLSSVRRIAKQLELRNRRGGGARIIARGDFPVRG